MRNHRNPRYAKHKDPPYEFEMKFNNDYQTSTPVKQAEYLASVVMEYMTMYGKLSNDHTKCLNQVKEWREMTFADIADEIPMDERQVRRIFNGMSKGSIQTLVAICIVLNLPPEISFHIIDKSPLSFSLVNTDHHWYRFVLQYLYGKKLDEVRVFLNTHNVTL
jgi:transcriptional regulator with XRE-family HTH domain